MPVYERPLPAHGSSLIVARRNHSTRTVIEQWRTRYAWVVYCVEHDTAHNIYTATDARQYASRPRDWCEQCEQMPEPVRRARNTGAGSGRRATALPSTAILGLERSFGVEIECAHDQMYDFDKVAKWISDAGIECARYARGQWRVKEDGSVHNDNGDYEGGFEVVSPPLHGLEGIKQVRTVLSTLQEHKFSVNHTCGLHIHIDARDLSVKQIAAFVRAWYDNQELIDWLVTEGRRNGYHTGYCNRISDSLVGEIENVSTKRSLAWAFEERYYTVNLSSLDRFGTIEIRQHHGTLSGAEFESWLRFIVGIVDVICSKGTGLGKSIGVRSLLNALPIDDETKAFLIGRALMRTPGAVSKIAA